jgi:hypothetical protein
MIRNAVRRRSNAATRCGLDRSLRPLAALLILLLAACSTPIGAWQAGSQSTNRTLTANLLSTGKLSAFTQNVLRLHALSATDDEDALAALKALHEAAAAADFPAAELFALSELAVQHAERRKDRSYSLAAAVYSYAFLFPDGRPADRPNDFDPKLRWLSAHIEEAQSEFIVRSEHSCQADPRTIAEVRRILLLHAQDACARDHVACAPQTAELYLSAAQ